MAAKKAEVEIRIEALKAAKLDVWVKGTSPLICNSMSEKAKRVLTMGSQREGRSVREGRAKHDPISEYRESPYLIDDAPTLIGVLASAFKQGMRTAALDMPGSSKAQIGRLLWAEGEYAAIYGRPYLFMSVTRSADINKTPDIRTRAILPRWAARITLSYVTPILNDQSVLNLLLAAGMIAGVGDWRPEKGSGNYGQYTIAGLGEAPPAFEDLEEILREGRAVQDEALARPQAYDGATDRLLTWTLEESERRGFVTAERTAVAVAEIEEEGEEFIDDTSEQ